MKICVLQPDYSDSVIDYGKYDPQRNLSSWFPDGQVDHVFLKKVSTYKQLKKLSKEKYDVFVNLCEGYLEWDIPSIDVIHSLELLNLPYTGPNAELFDPTKELMKYIAYAAGVQTPPFCVVDSVVGLVDAVKNLEYPMFVKPLKAGDSLGIDDRSRVGNWEELSKRADCVIEEFGEALIEQYIDGREFTVLVAADPCEPGRCCSFTPVEYVFPKNTKFKTYALKTSELHGTRNVPVTDRELSQLLKESSERIFANFQGKGYARMDYRMDNAGKLYFLEVNFSCSIFYQDGYEGSADHILKYDPIGHSGFLKRIVTEGIARHKDKQTVFDVRGNAVNGYGIYSRHPLKQGDVVFKGEGRSQRSVTKRFAKEHPHLFDPLTFRRYAYPVDDEVFIVWDESPSTWAPQNHSCDPNCVFDGLNIVAMRDISLNEELTLDYAEFLNESSEPFNCFCGVQKCRKNVKGTPGNSICARESSR